MDEVPLEQLLARILARGSSFSRVAPNPAIATTGTVTPAPSHKLAPITVSVRDATKITGLSRSFLYTEMRAARLAYVIKGRRRLLRMDALDSYLRGTTPAQETK